MTSLKTIAVPGLWDAVLKERRFGWDQGDRVAPGPEDMQLLVKAMVTYAITGIMVDRRARVAAAASTASDAVTWEVCEQRGYVTLISPGEAWLQWKPCTASHAAR